MALRVSRLSDYRMKSGKKTPPARRNLDAKSFFSGIHWFQKWELFEGIFTPGHNDIERICQDMGLPEDLSGKRVLDIGAWNGCMSFECERRGAQEVVALSPENPVRTGFDKLKKVLRSKVSYVRGSVYDLSPKRLGYFDVVLFCGVLYHLRYPLLGIDNIRRICRGDVYIESFIIDSRFVMANVDRSAGEVVLKSISPFLVFQPIWQFFRLGELGGDVSNWFGPNATAVLQAFESAGFDIKLMRHRNDRATFHATAKQGTPEFLAVGSCESKHYDVIMSSLFNDHIPGKKDLEG
ncbi:MAG: DUF1698 domain-containing protein [Deltaproteobacteria bacterium]|nr:DUF1698 domain-containing protein [Deltaproteobacteria bacterium]